MKRRLELNTGDKYQYIRWVITKVEGNPPTYGWAVQASEFVIYDKYGNRIYYPVESVATATPYVGHPNASFQYADKLIDNDTNNGKFYDPTTLPVTVQIDISKPVSIGYYGYYTAEDDFNRDPVSWEVYLSKDGSKYILADTQFDVTVTSQRNALVGKYKLNRKRGKL